MWVVERPKTREELHLLSFVGWLVSLGMTNIWVKVFVSTHLSYPCRVSASASYIHNARKKVVNAYFGCGISPKQSQIGFPNSLPQTLENFPTTKWRRLGSTDFVVHVSRMPLIRNNN